MELLLTALGLLLVLEGIPWFLSPSRCKALLRAVVQFGDRPLRLGGLLLMFAGLLLVRLARG